MRRPTALVAPLILPLMICAQVACRRDAGTAANANAAAAQSPTPNVEQVISELAKRDREEIRQHPDQPTGYYNLATTYFAAGRYGEAAEQYRHVIRLDPRDAAAHFELGQSLLRLDRAEEAAASPSSTCSAKTAPPPRPSMSASGRSTPNSPPRSPSTSRGREAGSRTKHLRGAKASISG